MFLRKLVLIVHDHSKLLEEIGGILSEAGLQVVTAKDDEEAVERLGRFFVPDLLMTRLPSDALDRLPPLLVDFRSNPLTRNLPAVVIASEDPAQRRASLRLGIPHIVQPPYDAEEILLNVRLALEQYRDDSQLSGSIAQLSVPDLLQTMETTQRSGRITLRSDGRVASLWLLDGQLIDAEIDDGRWGREAVFAIVFWDRGSFEVDFGPVTVPRRVEESTSHLLLEAMRRRDEAVRREQSPPNAALPDPPPAPPRPLRAVHRAVTLLNVASSYALAHMEPGILHARLEQHRDRLVGDFPLLGSFGIDEAGQVYWNTGADPELDVESLVRAVGRWLRAFFADAERILPGRFSVRKITHLTEALRDDLQELGFYEALGLQADATEAT